MTQDRHSRELALRKRFRNDFPFYAKKCLKIRNKIGKSVPLILNKPQLHIHDKLEEQKARTGKVRALILKGRKQGASTYIGARFYHRSTNWRGQEVFVMAHEQSASETLFKMTTRFHENIPPVMKASTGRSNAKELVFDVLDGGYIVATAGAAETGRSKTPLLFHGSEAAFWKNAATHMAGAIQAVPYEDGTEIILESTANGLGGTFHEMWQDAEAGIGDYQAIFIPWFWSPEYRRKPDPDFSLNDDEEKYKALHGLDNEQMAWRRAKIQELRDPMLFMQEFPATPDEAFQSTGHDSYIKTVDVLRARKADLEPSGPLIIGADPARSEAKGADRFGLAWRRGRKVEKFERWHGVDTVTAAGRIKDIIDKEDPKAVFIDAGGLGIGVIDILHSYGGKYKRIVIGVNFGSTKCINPKRFLDSGEEAPGPYNRRAEMWMNSKEWLEDELGADIPDENELQADAVAPGYKYNLKQQVILESKQAMKKRGIRSPDLWDAVALTFAQPVSNTSVIDEIEAAFGSAGTNGGGWQGN